MVSILSNGVDFLSIAKGAYANNGIGLSQRARALNTEFLSGAKTLFNTLYTQSEDAEVNLALQVRALRARVGADREDIVLRSQTRGRAVDTDA